MAKLLYAFSCSIDGFIAGPGGDMSWLTPHLHPDPVVDALIPRIGALLVGRRTYDGDDPHRGGPGEGQAFGGGWEGPQFVLTHRAAPAVPGVSFAGDLASAVAAAKAAAGDKYVNVLGADVARQCLDAGLLDEILALPVPVLLGGGVRMFDRPGPAVELEPLAAHWYRVLG
ncbi:dihydrofolate reductase family protein [Amycolatopsis vancoresmycina]|uniref:Deaminase-reductase domain-containing protein n=1 Tax=Amycolatopsis vancoresmycina DSM 44592 TaxID=1292037 RepID=R1HMF9_9PSEU|nr:dihydrofolate reductase family protein [Amycolatopsis vancoresmycina]EOD64745.1 deaminase-reductase domain-containing protein [Amycolatopsis vancoresmycina DSM 44592]